MGGLGSGSSFAQLFSLKKEWYHAEIERFFETIVTEDEDLTKMLMTFTRRVVEKDGTVLYVAKNET